MIFISYCHIWLIWVIIVISCRIKVKEESFKFSIPKTYERRKRSTPTAYWSVKTREQSCSLLKESASWSLIAKVLLCLMRSTRSTIPMSVNFPLFSAHWERVALWKLPEWSGFYWNKGYATKFSQKAAKKEIISSQNLVWDCKRVFKWLKDRILCLSSS